MADPTLELPHNPVQRREVLQQQAWRAVTQGIRTLPLLRHTAFLSAIVSELIEQQPTAALVDAIDRARLMTGGAR